MCDIMIDIQQTGTGDVDLSTGDLLYGESTGQHQRDILLSGKGHYKEFPELGVGALDFSNDNEPENFYRAVRKEFTRAGMKVTKVSMDETLARYEESDDKA